MEPDEEVSGSELVLFYFAGIQSVWTYNYKQTGVRGAGPN
jgi:hypothetical protein